ncbi:MAG: hypothetical protein M3547_07500, partial [Acidobacteriota bacterium]|nr:hypothetical protein [Acidobacteriota bacterium]
MRQLLESRLLSVLVFLPSAAAVLLLFFPESRRREAKLFALAASVVEFALSLPLWFRFDLGSGGMQFSEHASWIPALGISYSLGIDGISLLLVLLSTVLTPVSLLYSLT